MDRHRMILDDIRKAETVRQESTSASADKECEDHEQVKSHFTDFFSGQRALSEKMAFNHCHQTIVVN
ncbi:hypothetical protein KIN20_021234 [Parelaphostrongylus tenuis]|uniref:Uncharacterized protein n=1 Tax=Parelaphostrongylus tenuis TaxID=148309 RepID=A0AAD5QKK4_PARTN|nr:hypothetical protein KIN20_012850 [Parelaphostrongylus tenuis]KAJ1361867.1 hypothetical protein KIN20_021234 [Parelaphostrongylus tenuis]